VSLPPLRVELEISACKSRKIDSLFASDVSRGQTSMTDWYYTTNKQQRGPVSLAELRQLANRGLLKPTDLVWRDGMSDWAPASSQALVSQDRGAAEGEAADSGAAAEAPLAARSARLAPDNDDGRARRRVSRRDDHDEDDDQPRRRRTEGGMPVGAKIGLLVGGVVLFLLVGGVGLFLLLRPSRTEGVAAGMGNFNDLLQPNDVPDLKMGGPSRPYNVRLVQGRTYIIDLRSNQFDAFLRLEDSTFRQVAEDDDGGDGTNARIVYRCPRSGQYRVIATSLHQGQGAYTLSIREN
jgi:hypothetical protein